MTLQEIRKLLQKNAPEIYVMVQAHSPLPIEQKIADFINDTQGDQLPSSKGLRPGANTEHDRLTDGNK